MNKFVETEIEWLFYHLWTKNTPVPPSFNFKIADTVVLRNGVPSVWYFTSKDGYILKKDAKNVRIAKINKSFIKRCDVVGQSLEDIPCASVYQYA